MRLLFGTSRRRELCAALLLAVATAGLYAPVRRHAFVEYDDPDYVSENAQVRAGLTGAGVRWAFTTGTHLIPATLGEAAGLVGPVPR